MELSRIRLPGYGAILSDRPERQAEFATPANPPRHERSAGGFATSTALRPPARGQGRPSRDGAGGRPQARTRRAPGHRRGGASNRMKRIGLPGTDERLPAIGQGTWRMGESRRARTREVDALRLGLSLGLTLIDTAAVYGAGEAESIVGDAIADCREQVFVVTKVWPSHASAAALLASARASLRRLRTDRVDALLLHWPTRSVPLAETLGALAELRRSGLARHIGVSNFDRRWLERARAALPAGERLAIDQVPYSLGNRRAEIAVLPQARSDGQLVMAYSPLDRGRAARGDTCLEAIARRHDASPAQVALAWLIAGDGVVAIPKATRPDHVRANAAAADLLLTDEERQSIAAAHPPSGATDRLPILPPYAAFFRFAEAGLRLRHLRR